MATRPEVPDWTAGFDIQTTTKLASADGLGICIAELNSDDQANVLYGIVEGFSCYDDSTARAKQLAYIAAEFDAEHDTDPTPGRALAEFLEELAAAIRNAIGEPT